MECAINEIATDFGCVPNDPVGFVTKFYGIGVGILGGVVIIFLIVGGFTILTSQGNPERIQKGKEYIYYSIAGLLLAIFGFAFVRILAGGILKVPGFG